MNILYFDTSTDWIVVQIWNLKNKNLLYSFKESCPMEASFRLTSEIQQALISTKLKKPEAIVVAKGPGSFTGIRIAVTTARNLSQLWQIPCLGIDTLEIYTNYYYQKNQSKVCMVILDGKMQKFFVRVNKVNKSNENFIQETDKYRSQNFLESQTQDLTLLEIQQNLLHFSTEEINIFSNTIIDFPIKKLEMKEDYPDLNGTLLSNKCKNLFHSKNIQDYNYTTLIPNYMRGTYVD